jgi:DivIVA domain-containing protein
VTHVLIYLLAMAFVATMVFLLVSVVFGRGEELAPLPPGASPTRLPAEGLTGADVNALRFQQVMRGYKMSEVDWVLDRMAREIEELRGRVSELTAERNGAVPGTTVSGTTVVPGNAEAAVVTETAVASETTETEEIAGPVAVLPELESERP